MLDITRAYGLDFLFPEKDRAIGASLRNYGEFARPELDLICACLEQRPGAYVDIGANIGSIALPVAARFPQATVVAVEAHRGLSNVLAANALNNRLFNVEVIHAAAGPEAGLARFPSVRLSEEGNFGLLGMDSLDQFDSEAVRMCTLDEIAPADTRVVKIDVEGFEAKVLEGAGRVLKEIKPAWVLEARIKADDGTRTCMRVLFETGYSLFWFATPFVMTQPLKQGPPISRVKVDLNIVALPEGLELDWNLLPIESVDAPWPELQAAFRYVARYQTST